MINSVDPERETNLRPATPKGPDGGGSQYNEITRKRKQNAQIKQSKTQKRKIRQTGVTLLKDHFTFNKNATYEI